MRVPAFVELHMSESHDVGSGNQCIIYIVSSWAFCGTAGEHRRDIGAWELDLPTFHWLHLASVKKKKKKTFHGNSAESFLGASLRNSNLRWKGQIGLWGQNPFTFSPSTFHPAHTHHTHHHHSILLPPSSRPLPVYTTCSISLSPSHTLSILRKHLCSHKGSTLWHRHYLASILCLSSLPRVPLLDHCIEWYVETLLI